MVDKSSSHFMMNCWPSFMNDKLNKNVNHKRKTRKLKRSAATVPCESIPVNSSSKLLFQIIFLHSLDLAQLAKIANEYFCIVRDQFGFDLSRTFSTNDFCNVLTIKWKRVETVALAEFVVDGTFDKIWTAFKRFSLRALMVWAFMFEFVM